MGTGKHCEIERKYLIRMPDVSELRQKEDCAVWEIEQIYLTSEPGCTRRIRRVVEEGQTRWYKTFKTRLTDMTALEEEGEISAEEYAGHRKEADPALQPILKVRYRIPYEGQMLEVDVYPFWKDRAVLEIELESEDEPVHIPGWIDLIREVTDDYRYKNVRLAQEVPTDEV